MDPKFIEAIALRIKAGHTKEKIQAEVLGVGHELSAFLAAYEMAEESLLKKDSDVAVIPANKNLPNEDDSVGVGEMPSYQNLFDRSWFMAKSNVHLLLKCIITFIGTLIFSGMVGVLLIIFVPVSSNNDYVLKFVLLFILIAFSILALMACFTGLLRGLLKRHDSQRYLRHFWWAYLNIVGITLVSFYINILTQVGYFFFIIPGLLLSVYLMFTIYFAVSGERSGVAALTASTALVYGRFWPVLGRILASVTMLVVVILLIVVSSTLVLLLNPFFVPTFVLVFMAAILFVSFWQLCFTVTLFESLKNLKVAKPLPVAEKTLINIFRTMVGVVVVGTLILIILIGSGVVILSADKPLPSFWSKQEIISDATDKSTLKLAAQSADWYYQQNNTYTGVCNEVSLPEGAVCESTENTYVLETPLSWGYYCLDSVGYNEVKKRSAKKSGLCETVQESD